MVVPKNPCYKCERRSFNCHSNCGDYIDFRVDLEEYNKMVYKKKEQNRIMRDYVFENQRE